MTRGEIVDKLKFLKKETSYGLLLMSLCSRHIVGVAVTNVINILDMIREMMMLTMMTACTV